MPAQPSATFKIAAALLGACVPPLLFLLAVAIRRIRAQQHLGKAEKPSPELEDADLLPLCDSSSGAGTSAAQPIANGIEYASEQPVEHEPENQVSFALADGYTVTTQCDLLSDPPEHVTALRTVLATLGTDATRQQLQPGDLIIEYGITADCWLTATSATPIFAILRASHGLRVKQAPARLSPPPPQLPSSAEPRDAPEQRANATAASSVAAKTTSPALQWLASVAPLAAEKRRDQAMALARTGVGIAP